MQHDHDRGLPFDLFTNRRQLLKILAGASLAAVVACETGATSGSAGDASSGPVTTTASSSTVSPTAATANQCSPIPEETAGPYPGDGSNGPNALATSGIVRSDIRSSFGGLAGTAPGIPLSIVLTVTNTSTGCTPLEGYAIYLWHCDRDGHYSLYDLPAQNYLRGLQATDVNGEAVFTSIVPGCYAGRWPHIHFEIFPTAASATSAGAKLRTSQLAIPSNVATSVYATTGYEASQINFAGVSLQTDNVFSDGFSLQIPSLSGDVNNGFVLTLEVGIAA